ncbi:pyridoxamine 5'-phosphate oxidase family protein [Halobaculum limi]|uniref:pyridoxamine 5'-phosphate oxidase family protein n=1 Tax=Halobaculum limi TaxID=3031916 RepID=UPI002405B05C|nr:pyridoxamine 5'-phosphate oxidase family protein [Halobaculum sp. YSMS11]
MDVTDRVYTAGMTDDEVDDRLRETATGVLALSRADDAYAIPVSFAYDGEVIRFRLGDDGDSRKLAFAETTAEACFVVHGVEDERDSWSVVATGPLRRLSAEEWEAANPADIDEAYPPLRVFDEAIEETELVGYELQIESLTGRRTAE